MKKNFQMRIVQVVDCDTREEAEHVARAAKAAHVEFVARHRGLLVGEMRCELIKAAPKAFDSESVEGELAPKITPREIKAVVSEVIPLRRPRPSVIEKIPNCNGDGMTAESKAKLS